MNFEQNSGNPFSTSWLDAGEQLQVVRHSNRATFCFENDVGNTIKLARPSAVSYIFESISTIH